MNIAQPVLMILADKITNRLSYIVDTIFFKQALLVDDKAVFQEFAGYKIAYTQVLQADANLWIKPHGLLYESGIQQQIITCKEWDDLPSFFTADEGFRFDVLAASFYLIARYEEYNSRIDKDPFGRFKHEHALAYQQNFLHLPLINCWLKKMKEEQLLPASFQLPAFSFTPTYDIDIAYSYLHRGIIKNTGGFFKDFIKGNITAVEDRIAVLGSQKKDPYDIYAWLDLLHESLLLNPIYFFLLAQKQKGKDKNIDPNHPAMQALLKQHKKKYTIGIHPSLQSNSDTRLLDEEIKIVTAINQEPVTYSRQHYIQIQWPNTYRRLLEAGIRADFSMGYTNVQGFRASCSFPFKWYDIEEDAVTELVINPFCYMDSASIFHLGYNAQEAGIIMQQYMDTVKLYGGDCILIHHNNFLTAQPRFLPWKLAYADFLISNFTR
jgi:hypothetical protein